MLVFSGKAKLLEKPPAAAKFIVLSLLRAGFFVVATLFMNMRAGNMYM